MPFIKFNCVTAYFDVEAETWEDFHSADSIGEFFNQEIKGNYECDCIDNIYDEDYQIQETVGWVDMKKPNQNFNNVVFLASTLN